MENIHFEQIKKEISSHDVVLYMKGNATFPQCGFSATVVQILSQYNITFKDVNILEDNVLRENIKEFSEWPTIPQLYIKGEFIGGCDIVREMFETGELQTLLEQHNIAHSTNAA